MSFPTLTSKRLILRQPRNDDRADYHAIVSKPEVTRYSDLPDHPTRKDTEGLFRWMKSLHSKGTGCGWIVASRRSGKIWGAIRINDIRKRDRMGTVGYEFDPAQWGRGVASEALGLVVTSAFSDFDLHRLQAWTMTGNPASDRVLEKNGFQHEGVLRQARYFKDAFHDMRMFGCLNDSQ